MAVDTVILSSYVWSTWLCCLFLIANRSSLHRVTHKSILSLCKLPHHLLLALSGPPFPRLRLLFLLPLLSLSLSCMLSRPHLGPAHLDELLASHVQITDLVKHLFNEETTISYSTVSVRLAAGGSQLRILPSFSQRRVGVRLTRELGVQFEQQADDALVDVHH